LNFSDRNIDLSEKLNDKLQDSISSIQNSKIFYCKSKRQSEFQMSINYDILSDISNPKFQNELTKSSNRLSPKDIFQCFQTIFQNFDIEEPGAECTEILGRDRQIDPPSIF
jgi:hypothetical protein